MKRHLVKLILLGVTMTSWGCAALSPEQSRTYSHGIEAQDDQCWSEAIAQFRKVIQQQPRFNAAWIDIAACKFHLGLIEESTVDLQNVLGTQAPNRKESAKAYYYLGRCHVERARDWRNSSPDESRILFAVALDTFERAWENGSMNYDTAHWIGYANLRLDRVDDAVDALNTCAELDPDRSEHQVLLAVTENASGIPGHDPTTFFSLAKTDRTMSLGLLYEHLADLYPDLDENAQATTLDILKNYQAANFVTTASIDALILRVETERQAKILHAKLDEFRMRLAAFEESKQYTEALQFIEDSRDNLSESLELDEIGNDIRERWSAELESTASRLLASTSRDELQVGLDKFRHALKLTKTPSKRIVLQQKIEALQVSLNRVPPHPNLLSVQTLLKSSQFHQALKELEEVQPENLAESEREPYYYLLGLARYNVGRWADAVTALQEVHTPSFWDVHQMRGICYWRTGKRDQALEDLAQVALESRSDESLRILGHHFLSRDNHEDAAENLERLANSSPHDLDALQRALTVRGVNEGAAGRWEDSIESLREARKIVESRLNRRGPQVYLELGRAYWHVEDFERAEKTIRDLLDMELDTEELNQVREAYLFRGLLSNRARAFSTAFDNFQKFLRLGGTIPNEWRDSYNRLVAVFSDYMPLAAGNLWEFRSPESDETMTIHVTRQDIGSFAVEITADGDTAVEEWNVGANFLHQTGGVGKRVLPVRLSAPDGPFASVLYRSSNTLFTSAIVAIGETVKLENGKSYANCVKVRTSSERDSVPVIVRYFAPSIGEVCREIFEAETRIKTWELESFKVGGKSS
jgi:tetratricopeptide (TPR) repeat protein